MRKKTIGEVLKLARTNQGLSLEELSKKTDIQQDLLEALERNDYDLLPSPFYARSFLRKYAWAVDLDESIILEAYEAGEMIVFDEVALAADEEFRSRKNKNKSSFLPLFYFLLLASAIAAFVAYYIWSYAHTNFGKFSKHLITIIVWFPLQALTVRRVPFLRLILSQFLPRLAS